MSKIVTHDPILKNTLIKEQELIIDSHPDSPDVEENEFRRLMVIEAVRQADEDLQRQLENDQ
jgi:hypothetical protein